jgi:branched-chain amino acid aminotransferase
VSALVNVNGVISSPNDPSAKVSVFDRGFLFGDGVYETGRSYDRCFLFWEEHLSRLRKSASKLAINVPWSDEEITKRLGATALTFGKDNLYFRVIVTRGVISSVGLDIEQDIPPTLVIIVQDLSSKTEGVRRQGVKLLTSKVIRNAVNAQDPNIKTSNYLNSLLALHDVRGRGADDAVLCNQRGELTEGTTFSVFTYFKTRNELFTPSLDVGILDSITRRHVIEVAKPLMKVREGALSAADCLLSDEVFIASSVREIVPVRNWDGREFPVPGEKTRILHDALRESIRSYVSSHSKY